MARPLIGITAYNYIRPPMQWRYDVSYGRNAAAIEEAGGLPVLIPSMVSLDALREIYERLDGVMLPGGGDINPERYRTAPEDDINLYDISDERDAMEISLTQWSVEDDLPVFGICRGIQVMNVALGGTLIQDVPKHIDTDLRHSIKVPDETRDELLHDVSVSDGTLLKSILGESTIAVNSIHHQSIRDVAPNAIVTATAPDGVVEGIELEDKHFVLAVQWHPEDLTGNDERMMNLFTAFVEAARQRMSQK